MQLKNTFRNSKFWQQLLAKKQSIIQQSISQLWSTDPNRFKNFSVNIDNLNLLVDFSKQYVDSEVIKILCNAAKHCELEQKIKDLFKGAKINVTEEQRVWHTALREPTPAADIAAVLQKITDFTEKLYKNNYQNILCLGIGGSYLGPMMVCQALDGYTHKLAKNLNFYFIANSDPETINNILVKLNPATTIAIISSKSFATEETIRNMKVVTSWLKEPTTVFAVTCNINKAIECGINLENIFPFWNFVGGRYSVWSAVGLPIAIKLGMENFKKFLNGAYRLDQHFINTDFANNLPILLALIGIWNINFMQYKSLAIMPYLDSLEYFPSYLQQVEMESNGKTIDLQNNYLDYDTSPVIWGGVGCNGQHSYMQMLHQGSQIVPVDFLVATRKSDFLFANCLAQSQALMQGTSDSTKLEKFKHCNGNRPNTIILFSELTPEILGALIALYEHKVFVQGIMWNINSFDQFGVELGKKLANKFILKLEQQPLNNDYSNLLKL